jgi:hypothetical protein
MARLSAAYYGYNHQDIVTACALALILIPRSEVSQVSAESKVTPDDRFDDLELVGAVRRRVQVKAHSTPERLLRLSDITTNAMDFRIDRAVRSVVQDSNPAQLYTLFTTFPPASDLVAFLQPTRSVHSVLTGNETSHFRLVQTKIWPDGQAPAWAALESVERTDFARFCEVFAIEAGCPSSSGDLRAPGPLERELLVLLRDGVGVGVFPNDSRDVADAAAHLIYAARAAREGSRTVVEQDVVKALALRIDYGRVEEHFPVDVNRSVRRMDLLDEIVPLLRSCPRLAVTGPPGIGKSWLVRQLRSRLHEDGWVVSAHYCFIDLFDNDRYRRASVATTFGSIMAELYDVDRRLLPDGVPRFASGPGELERVLRAAVEADSNRRIAIIVDGLDHVDRLAGGSQHATAEEIVEELAMLAIPPGIAVIIVSQPGEHLRSFLAVGLEYPFVRWPDHRIRELVQRTELEQTLVANGLEGDTQEVIECVVNKATGSPLYATYLVRTALGIVRQQSQAPVVADIAEHLGASPQFDRDLSSYYGWLVEGLDRDTGVMWIAGMLALLDFALTSEEIKEIRPDFRTYADRVLNRLAPVLADDIVRGGIRIYHESFQRYMRGRLDADRSDVPFILSPVISWLEGRGFYSDVRAFRSLFTLLRRGEENRRFPEESPATLLRVRLNKPSRAMR